MTERRGKYGQRSTLEQVFLTRWRQLAKGCPPPQEEFHFHPTRKWRFDFAWPTEGVAVECEGGTYSGGRHTRGTGFAKDCEKYNAATEMGWRVFRCTADMLKAAPQAFIAQVVRTLKAAQAQ